MRRVGQGAKGDLLRQLRLDRMVYEGMTLDEAMMDTQGFEAMTYNDLLGIRKARAKRRAISKAMGSAV